MFKDTNNTAHDNDKAFHAETTPPVGAVTEIFRKKFSAVVVTPSSCNLNVRYRGNPASPILGVIKFGEIVDVESSTEDGWTKVRTSSNLIGYCQTKYLRRRST